MAQQTKETKKNEDLGIVKIDRSNIPKTISKLEQAIKKLKHIEDTPWKSSGTISGFPTNIRNETLIPNLIRMFSVFVQREKAYYDAADILGIKTRPVYDDNGATREGIEEDVKLRIEIIQQKDTLDKLNEFKQKASKFMSEEDQKRDLFDQMESFLNKDS